MNRSLIIPAGILVLLVVVLGFGLMLDPLQVPSPLIEKLAPKFSLVDFADPNRTLTNQDLLGKVWLVNVWASWCVSCRSEHALLMGMVRSGRISLFGLNYRDQPEDARHWLESRGNPYKLIGVDATGQVGLDWGIQGTPESFVLDRQGMVRFVQIGPLSSDVLQSEILPLMERLQDERAL